LSKLYIPFRLKGGLGSCSAIDRVKNKKKHTRNWFYFFPSPPGEIPSYSRKTLIIYTFRSHAPIFQYFLYSKN
jgi:hypothetical protein